jgi:hypothetical protein
VNYHVEFSAEALSQWGDFPDVIFWETERWLRRMTSDPVRQSKVHPLLRRQCFQTIFSTALGRFAVTVLFQYTEDESTLYITGMFWDRA